MLADAVRLAHRAAAMAVSVAALLVAWLAWSRRPVSWGLRLAALAIVVLVAALAVLGRSSAGTPSTAVAIGNLLGGLVLLGLCAGLATAGALASPPRAGAPHGPTAAATALLAAGLATGAVAAVLPAAGLDTLHAILGWTLVVSWAGLAGRRAAPTPCRSASAVTAGLLVALAALAALGPGRAASPAAAWLHNGLAAAALCSALAALSRSRPSP